MNVIGDRIYSDDLEHSVSVEEYFSKDVIVDVKSIENKCHCGAEYCNDVCPNCGKHIIKT